VLDRFPLIDGHNDLPWEIRAQFGGDLEAIDLTGRVESTQTVLLRLADGPVSAGFRTRSLTLGSSDFQAELAPPRATPSLAVGPIQRSPH
jgi:hypothetical protein